MEIDLHLHQNEEMKNYKLQNGCHNCVHRFEFIEYDQRMELFCTLDAPKRPKCNSVALGEIHARYDAAMYNEAVLDDDYKKWDEWSESRAVQPAGKCEGFERIDEKPQK